MTSDTVEVVCDAVGYVRAHARLFFGIDRPSLDAIVGGSVCEALARGGGAVVVLAGESRECSVVLLRTAADYLRSVDEFNTLQPQPERGFRAHGWLVMIRAFSSRVLTRGSGEGWRLVGEDAGGTSWAPDEMLSDPAYSRLLSDADLVCSDGAFGRDIMFEWPNSM